MKLISLWRRFSSRRRGLLLIVASVLWILGLGVYSVFFPETFLSEGVFYYPFFALIGFISMTLILGIMTFATGREWKEISSWWRIPALGFGILLTSFLLQFTGNISNNLLYDFLYQDVPLEVKDFSEHYLRLEELMTNVETCTALDRSCLQRFHEDITRTNGYMNDLLEYHPGLKSQTVIYPISWREKRVLRYQDFQAMMKSYSIKLVSAEGKAK